MVTTFLKRCLYDFNSEKHFYENDSVIIKYKNENGKYSVANGVIAPRGIGTKYLYLRITPEYSNHKQSSSWWCNKKIIISNIVTIKSFKNTLDREALKDENK